MMEMDLPTITIKLPTTKSNNKCTYINLILLYFNNFVFVRYLKCTQKGIKKKPCPARAVIRNYDNMIRHSGEPHTHKPRNYDEDLLKRNFLMKIRERAINENTPNRKIFDEEIKKLDYFVFFIII